MDLAEGGWGEDQSPVGGEATGPQPTDRGTCGTKRRVLTEGHGMPRAVVVAGANRHDRKRLAATWDAAVLERPAPTAEAPHQVCWDQGYDDEAWRQEAERRGDIPHRRSRGEAHQERRELPGDRARRWGVEVCHAWLHRFRKILVRFETKLATHLALLQCACADMALKRADVFR